MRDTRKGLWGEIGLDARFGQVAGWERRGCGQHVRMQVLLS